MKKLISVFVSWLMVIPLAAQDQQRLQDHLLMKDGVVLQVRDNDQVRLRDRVVLEDGSFINIDGSYITAMGEQRRLRDGECLDMDGNWYGTQAQFRNDLPQRQQAMNQLHYVLENGQMYRLQNQKREQLRGRLQLSDGSAIQPDGNLELRDRERIRLRDGECIDPEGNVYGNTAQFRKEMKLSEQAMMQEHYALQDGQLYRIENRERTRVQDRVQLQNGIVVFPDGSYELPNQERMAMQSGEYFDNEGNMYASPEQFRQHARIQLQAANHEHFTVSNGQMFQVMDQQRIRVREQLALHSGVIINPDGTYQLRNRQQERLRDGECLDPDGNRYSSQAQFREQMQLRLNAMSEPYFVYRNGKMYRAQNQIQSPLHDRWTFRNGAAVEPDGNYQLKNRKQQRLRDGEYLDWEGRRYENQDRFRERMEARVRDRMELRDRERMQRKGLGEPGRRPLN